MRAIKTLPVRWKILLCVLAAPLVIGNLLAQDFEYTITNGTITVTNYIGAGGNVAIPASIAGIPVTVIGGVTFQGSATLRSVTIPRQHN
jgi:hypothetical protein